MASEDKVPNWLYTAIKSVVIVNLVMDVIGYTILLCLVMEFLAPVYVFGFLFLLIAVPVTVLLNFILILVILITSIRTGLLRSFLQSFPSRGWQLVTGVVITLLFYLGAALFLLFWTGVETFLDDLPPIRDTLNMLDLNPGPSP